MHKCLSTPLTSVREQGIVNMNRKRRIENDATLVSNYRPISIFSAIPKILEKVMFDQLYDAFQPLFSFNMSGFLRGHSCCIALVKMVDDWRLALDSKLKR